MTEKAAQKGEELKTIEANKQEQQLGLIREMKSVKTEKEMVA